MGKKTVRMVLPTVCFWKVVHDGEAFVTKLAGFVLILFALAVTTGFCGPDPTPTPTITPGKAWRTLGAAVISESITKDVTLYVVDGKPMVTFLEKLSTKTKTM